jgi:sodium/proline symporter
LQGPFDDVDRQRELIQRTTYRLQVVAERPLGMQHVPVLHAQPLELGFLLYLLGFVFGGLGAIGQPHILVRSMAIRGAEQIGRARTIYFLWYVPFSIAAVACGLYSRVLLPDLLDGVSVAQQAVAAEQALPGLATMLLPGVLLGVLLAGVFAATMSTADSQILSCSAAVTQDLAPRYRDSYLGGKIATLAVAADALVIALFAGQSVFTLVLAAWSALGAAFGPLLILRILRLPVAPPVASAMMITGVGTIFTWSSVGLSDDVFELLPGMLAPFLVYLGYALFTRLAPTGR